MTSVQIIFNDIAIETLKNLAQLRLSFVFCKRFLWPYDFKGFPSWPLGIFPSRTTFPSCPTLPICGNQMRRQQQVCISGDSHFYFGSFSLGLSSLGVSVPPKFWYRKIPFYFEGSRPKKYQLSKILLNMRLFWEKFQ